MKIEEVRHKFTRMFIQEHNINLDLFEKMEDLREFINKNRNRLYMKKNAEYYRNYMRKYNYEKYLREHPNCVRKPRKTVKVDLSSFINPQPQPLDISS